MKLKYAVILGALVATSAHADGVFTRTVVKGSGGASSGSGITGSGSSGQNAYWSSATNLTFDSLISDTGTGSLNLVNVSATGIVSGSTLSTGNYSIVGTGLRTNTTGSAIDIQRSSGTSDIRFATNAPTPNGGISIANGAINPASELDVSGSIRVWSPTVGSQTSPSLYVSGTTARVGVNTLLPNAALDVRGTTSTTMLSAATNVTFTALATAPTRTGSVCLSANGDVISASVAGCVTSAPEMKMNIKAMPEVMPGLLKLSALTYDYRPDTGLAKNQVGLISHDAEGFSGMESIFPQLVEQGSVYHGEITKTVNYQQFTAVLLKGIQEQQVEIDELRQHVGLPPKYAGFFDRVKWLFTGR